MSNMNNLTKHLSTSVVACVFQLALAPVNASSRPGWEWSISSRASLTHISHRMSFTKQPIERLSGPAEEDKEPVSWVSAEKVFVWVVEDPLMPQDCLVHGMHRGNVKPADPTAKTVVGKWGSSYNTWWMSREKWELAKHFWWYHDMKDLPLPFPMLWDKRPDLCGEAVPVLGIDFAIHSVPRKKLDAYLKAALQWVEPKTLPVEEVLQMLRSDAVEKRISGVRLLGARKDAEYAPTIADAFKDQRMEVRRAAAWALGRIGGPGAMAHLRANVKDRSGGVREEIASALGEIGGLAAVEPLARLLKDKDRDVRKNAAAAMAATGSEKAVPYLLQALGDEDKATRQAALESLLKLGWQPPKQETAPDK